MGRSWAEEISVGVINGEYTGGGVVSGLKTDVSGEGILSSITISGPDASGVTGTGEEIGVDKEAVVGDKV